MEAQCRLPVDLHGRMDLQTLSAQQNDSQNLSEVPSLVLSSLLE